MKEIGQHCGRRLGADQPLGLEGLHGGGAQMFALGIQQTAPGSANAIGAQSLFEVVGLQKHRQAGDGAFFHRCRSQRGERGPEVLLDLGRDGNALAGQDGHQPIRSPCALGNVADPGEGLERNAVRAPLGKTATQIVPVAAHGKRRRADRSPEIEGEDLRACIAAKLQRHERQQHRFTSAGRADDECMADVADVKGKPERGRAFGLAEEQWGRCKMLVPFRPRPHC